jgi:D-alanine-D-alanine ligase
MKGLEISVINGFGFDIRSFESNENGIVNKIEKIGFPIIIKPSRQGSSVGISICKNISDLLPQVNKAFLYDEKVLIEKFVQIKKEVNIALFRYKGDIIYSTTEEPIKFGEYLSFDEKYRKSGGDFEKIKRIVPANITQEQLNEIESIATKVYDNLDAVGIIRFDFIIDENDKIYLNEVNTIPGSMANYLFKENFDYAEIIDMLVKNAVFVKRASQIKTIDSGVLEEGIWGIKK